MKKPLLFLFVFTLAQMSFGQAYIYHPFPTTMAIWNDHGHTDTHFELRWDTVIAGHTYKQIHYIYNEDTALVSPLSTYSCAVREENKKVYILWDPTDTTEHLLYDFGVSVGDSMRFDYNISGMPTYFTRYVASVDSIQLLDGHYRKRFNMIPGYNCAIPDTVVEGIGSINWKGFFNPLENQLCTCGFYYEFTCFWEDTAALYTNNCPSCFCHMGVLGIDEAAAEPEPEVYPNPFSNETSITVDKELKNGTLVLYNTFGQEMRQINNISGTTVKLSREGLPAGVYFISLTENNTFFTTGKLIITEN